MEEQSSLLSRFGFSVSAWEQFADALREHAATHDVVEEEVTPYGTSYIVGGQMVTPDGRNPVMGVVWFVDRGDAIPRLVTAYPPK